MRDRGSWEPKPGHLAVLVLGLALSGCSANSTGKSEVGLNPDLSLKGDGHLRQDLSKKGDGPKALDQGTDRSTGSARCGFDPQVVFNFLGEVLQLESSDRETCLLARRRNDSDPNIMYKAVPFTLLEMRVGHQGVVVTASDTDKLSWSSTHHNWNDQGEATAGDTRFRLLYEFNMDLSYSVTAFDLSGAIKWGPIALLPFNPQ